MPRWTDKARLIASKQMQGNTRALGHHHTDEWRKATAESMQGNTNAKGTIQTAEANAKRSRAMLGNSHLLGHRHSIETRAKMSASRIGNKHLLGHKHSDETLLKMSAVKMGKKNSAYIDGRSRERQHGRLAESQTVAYKLWRRTVLQRDKFTCQICGDHGVTLCVDHIKPWRYFPELRYDLGNGRALCIPCHRQTDTYGSKVHKCIR